MAGKMHGADELFKELQKVCVGKPAADVMYAMGRMIAKGVMDNTATADLDTTMDLLRSTAELEINIGR